MSSRCLRPLMGLLVTACVGSPPPPPEPAATNDATTGDPTSTSEPVVGTGTTTAAESTGGLASTTTEAVCDPPCQPGQECFDGTCFDVPGESTTGEPPMECGLAVMLQFPNPACGPCAEDACCVELQGCFGDETTMEMTECLELNNCIAMSCAMSMSVEEVQTCIDATCPRLAGWFDTWLAYQSCLGMSCAAECS